MGVIRAQVGDFGGAERCMLIGGGQTAPDWAAFYNGALVLIEKARSKRVRGSQPDRATGELAVGYRP